MNLVHLYNLIVDKFQKPLNRKVVLITNEGIPVIVYQNMISICSPAFSTGDRFGFRSGSGLGYLTHDESRYHRVNQPRIGQEIYLWSRPLYRAVYTGQTIRRIYDFSFDISMEEIRLLLNQIRKLDTNLEVSKLRLLEEYPAEMYYNKFLSMVLFTGIFSPINDWKLTESDTTTLYEFAAKMYPEMDLDYLFRAGFITEQDKRLVVSPVLKILLVEAIQKARPHFTTISIESQLTLK